MHIKPNLPKPKELHLSLVNSDSQYQRAKVPSRKRVIMPISSEAEILAASASHKRSLSAAAAQTTPHRPTNTQVTKTPSDPRHTLTPTKDQTHLRSGSEARINAQIELELLSSSLDEKNRRLKQSLAFIAQVLFWAAATYVIIL